MTTKPVDAALEKEEEQPTRLPRRRFLQLGAVGGALVVAACATGNTPSASASPTAAATPTAGPSPKPTAPPGDKRIFYNNSPFLEESKLSEVRSLVTPNEQFFVRWHAVQAQLTAADYKLSIEGKVGNKVSFSLDDLKRMPSQSVIAVIECAGNGRGYFPADPKVSGTAWHYGAASCAEWTGVSVKTLLDQAGLDPAATQIVFVGGDQLGVTRGLPRDKALDPDTIVAYSQNGEAVRPENGFPARLLVPRWVGVANIKVPVRMIAIADESELDPTIKRSLDAYTTAQYVYNGPAYPDKPRAILQTVKAAIARPAPDESITQGAYSISGFAWSGSGSIARVEVSVDDGPFQQALIGPQLQHSWAPFNLVWKATAGAHTIRARATDSAGNTQPAPEQVKYNALGYGYNGTVPVKVTVT